MPRGSRDARGALAVAGTCLGRQGLSPSPAPPPPASRAPPAPGTSRPTSSRDGEGAGAPGGGGSSLGRIRARAPLSAAAGEQVGRTQPPGKKPPPGTRRAPRARGWMPGSGRNLPLRFSRPWRDLPPRELPPGTAAPAGQDPEWKEGRGRAGRPVFLSPGQAISAAWGRGGGGCGAQELPTQRKGSLTLTLLSADTPPSPPWVRVLRWVRERARTKPGWRGGGVPFSSSPPPQRVSELAAVVSLPCILGGGEWRGAFYVVRL